MSSSPAIPPFVLYVKPGCPWCDDAIAWLDERGYSYDEVDVYSDQAGYAEMQRLTRQGKCPTLKVGDEAVLPDFDTGQLEKFLAKHGWLKQAA